MVKGTLYVCREVVVLLFVRWWRTERSLLFLPHPGIGPSQSAEGVWPGERVWLEGGSDTKGRGFGRFRRERRARGTKEKTKGKRSSQFGKLQSLGEGVLVCRSSERSERTKASYRGSVCGEQSLSRGCSCFEASERQRGCLHVESAIDSKERKGDSTERGTERTKLKSGFEAGRQERRRRRL